MIIILGTSKELPPIMTPTCFNTNPLFLVKRHRTIDGLFTVIVPLCWRPREVKQKVVVLMAMQKEGSENKTRKQKRAYYSTTIPANQTETIAIQPIKHSQYP